MKILLLFTVTFGLFSSFVYAEPSVEKAAAVRKKKVKALPNPEQDPSNVAGLLDFVQQVAAPADREAARKPASPKKTKTQ